MKPRVLVVEDEQTISEPLAEHLEREGFDAGGRRHDRGGHAGLATQRLPT